MPRPSGARNTDLATRRAAVIDVLSGADVPETARRYGINLRRLYSLVEEARREYEAALSGALEEVEYWREVEALVLRNGRET